MTVRELIYLDSAATSYFRPPEVWEAVRRSMQLHAGYGRSGHRAAAMAEAAVYDCRCAAASFFHLPGPERVVFTWNATHALNTAIFGLAEKGKRVVLSGYEHNAVLRPLRELERRGDVTVDVAASPLDNPEDAVAAFDSRLDDSCGLCVCTMVSNVFGTVLPVGEIGRLCRSRGIPFVVDASQAAGTIDVDAEKLDADVICVPGHKGLLGPTGTGMMLLCSDRYPRPMQFGGTGGRSADPAMPEEPPERYESGTLNVAGICGLGAGIRFVSAHQPWIRLHESALAAYLRGELAELPGVTVYPSSAECGLFSFSVDCADSETVAADLAARNIAVRGGLHCAPLAHQTAGTMNGGTVRVSFGFRNSRRECDRFLYALSAILREK